MSVRRTLITLSAVALAAVAGFLLLPKVGELGHTWSRVSSGDSTWLLVAVGLEVLSFVGYVVLFRAVFVRCESRIDWRESYQITMAGLAATRLLAAGGAGGVALTAWALKRSGMNGRTVTQRMTSFMVILYGIYMAALLVDGVGLATGLFGVHASAAVTIAPAAFGGLVIVSALAMSRLRPLSLAPTAAGDERGLRRRFRHLTLSVAAGVRGALGLARSFEPGCSAGSRGGASTSPCCGPRSTRSVRRRPVAVIVMGYFVGTLANTLPLPGGVGGVDGGMIGAFLAFGVDPGTAVLAVLSYRAIAFWLPTLPGLMAYLQLRRTVGDWKAEDAAADDAVPMPARPHRRGVVPLRSAVPGRSSGLPQAARSSPGSTNRTTCGRPPLASINPRRRSDRPV